MVKCPVCSTNTNKKVENTPYWDCPHCGCWFQDPLPDKVYEADHEKDDHGGYAGHLMSDHDKNANLQLAGALSAKMQPNGVVLDIGSKYPYLAHCFRELGHESFGIDGIDIVPEYSKELGVPMICADFEKLTPDELVKAFGIERFDMITMVHVFEHMYNPLTTLRVLRSLVKEDGRVFIRLPDHSVLGYERDLTPGHFTIHPYFHALSSMLELLVQAEDLFVVETYRPMAGAGQSDYVLKPITKKPSVVAGMIVKNEEKHLPACLKSIEGIVDAVVIVDTGSVDKTKEVALNTISKPVHFSVYTDASKQDETGDWKLWDFSKARNQFVQKIEDMGADYVLWMDADDTLMTPRNLQRAFYLNEFGIFGIRMSAGKGGSWIHHRLWKTGQGIVFQGAIHEYPTLDKAWYGLTLDDTFIVHNDEQTATEHSLDRNLRILMKEYEQDPNNSRTLFYLANTYIEKKDFLHAIEFYEKRIEIGEFYRDEWLFAHLYIARCYREISDYDEAKKWLHKAIGQEASWAEFWAELALLAYNERKWWEAIGNALLALTKPVTHTQLWRETEKYKDQPCRILSWAYQSVGNRHESLFWARKAKFQIGKQDDEWDARIASLERTQVAFVRPGAIGDIIMTMNIIPEFIKQHPNTEVHYYCAAPIGNQLREFMEGCGVAAVHDVAEFGKMRDWYDKVYELVGYPLAEGYPLVPMSQHLLRYFAKDADVELATGADLPTVILPLPTRHIEGNYATIHPKAGWSAYKNWPIERWAEVVANSNFPVFQIGAADDPKVPGANHDFMGKKLEVAISLIANATIHMGVDSFTNHLTHIEWFNAESGYAKQTPAVILWGSTQYSAAGYKHNTNISLGLECQPCFREDPKISQMPIGVCINPPGQTYEQPQHACMAGITVERVIEAVQQLWNVESVNESVYRTVSNVVGPVSDS